MQISDSTPRCASRGALHARQHSEGDLTTILTVQERAEAIADAYQPPLTGRPSLLSDDLRLQKLFTALREGCPRETACKLSEIGNTTFYNLLKANNGDNIFRETVEKLEAEAECDAIRNVRQAGKLPQFWAAEMTYLERKYPDRWGRRQDDSSVPKVVVQIGVQSTDVKVLIASPPQVNGIAHYQTHTDSEGQQAQSLPAPYRGALEAKVVGESATAISESGARPSRGPQPGGRALSSARKEAQGKGRFFGSGRKKKG